jgi:hypothetical protein
MSPDNNNLGTIAKDARIHVLVERVPSPDGVLGFGSKAVLVLPLLPRRPACPSCCDPLIECERLVGRRW